MNRFLVTGATGFLGTHLVATLTAAGHEVVALVRGGTDRVAADSPLRHPRVTLRVGDVQDEASVRDAAAGCSGAFHCAGKVSRRPEDAEELYRLHVEGTKHVVRACRAAGVGRLVLASTSGTVAVSEDPNHVATEDDEAPIHLIARWPYYRSKLFAERAALEENGEGFEVISVNPSLLLGPGDVNGSSTNDVRLFLERKIPAIPPGGLSFVDVRDAAEAMRLAMSHGKGGQRYLVGACNLSLREFFGRLERISGVKGPWLPMPRALGPLAGPDRVRAVTDVGVKAVDGLARRLGLTLPVDPVSMDMAQHYFYLDSSRAERELGWRPRDPMKTLADTVADLRARGVVWPEPSRTTWDETPP